ncbi:sigma-70 family RNA polymerase sigma factor [Streptomyces abyssomicinicus]|uniref:sigma-70 family RNA polymerase sigma factor n=1 Tax=Streptomyces abyssomicinicus TaxID=574929 RepID=UPI00124F93B0|nr:sigma-70 family RNA polymerase sigma factor [Streptomyces abyssomicinicus]
MGMDERNEQGAVTGGGTDGGAGWIPEQAGPGASAHDAGGAVPRGQEPWLPAQRDAGSALEGPDTAPPGSDAELIVRMRSGDDSAYEALYRRHADAVRRYARTCCRDPHTADDLTAEVFAGMLQAVRGGAGPRHAVRAYLLTTVRRTAAGWTRTARREQLVDDFAVFVEQTGGTSDRADDDTLELAADVRAMHLAEQSLAVRAFRSLPERWQAVLWHTEVEDESPGEVATLFGLDANGTRVLASRAREGLKQAYLQAHVSAALTADAECARYADRLGAFARGGLRIRAERGMRRHLEECARCRTAAGQIRDVAQGIPAVVPVAVIGWFGTAGYAKVAGLLAGGAGTGAASVGGSAAAGGGAASGAAGSASGGAAGGAGAGGGAGGGGGGGGGALGEGLGAPAKAGIAAGVVTVAAAVLALALVGNDGAPRETPPVAGPPPVSEPAAAPEDVPEPPPAAEPAVPADAGPTAGPAPEPRPSPARSSAEPAPSPSRTAGPKSVTEPEPDPKPSEAPPPLPEPVVPAEYRWSGLPYGITGDGTGPEMRIGESTWVWQRRSLSVAGVTYPHGVTVNGWSSVVVDLNRPCTSYRAMAGIDDMGAGLGSAVFSVFADGERLWRSGVLRGGDPAVPVSVSLSGRRTVRLVVEPHDSGVLVPADWAESRFTCG